MLHKLLPKCGGPSIHVVMALEGLLRVFSGIRVCQMRNQSGRRGQTRLWSLFYFVLLFYFFFTAEYCTSSYQNAQGQVSTSVPTLFRVIFYFSLRPSVAQAATKMRRAKYPHGNGAGGTRAFFSGFSVFRMRNQSGRRGQTRLLSLFHFMLFFIFSLRANIAQALTKMRRVKYPRRSLLHFVLFFSFSLRPSVAQAPTKMRRAKYPRGNGARGITGASYIAG